MCFLKQFLGTPIQNFLTYISRDSHKLIIIYFFWERASKRGTKSRPPKVNVGREKTKGWIPFFSAAGPGQSIDPTPGPPRRRRFAGDGAEQPSELASAELSALTLIPSPEKVLVAGGGTAAVSGRCPFPQSSCRYQLARCTD